MRPFAEGPELKKLVQGQSMDLYITLKAELDQQPRVFIRLSPTPQVAAVVASVSSDAGSSVS